MLVGVSRGVTRTVAIDVVITAVSHTVTVRVPLISIRDVGTVITRIAVRVCVGVLLVLIGHQTTIILQKSPLHSVMIQTLISTTLSQLQLHHSAVGRSFITETNAINRCFLLRAEVQDV